MGHIFCIDTSSACSCNSTPPLSKVIVQSIYYQVQRRAGFVRSREVFNTKYFVAISLLTTITFAFKIALPIYVLLDFISYTPYHYQLFKCWTKEGNSNIRSQNLTYKKVFIFNYCHWHISNRKISIYMSINVYEDYIEFYSFQTRKGIEEKQHISLSLWDRALSKSYSWILMIKRSIHYINTYLTYLWLVI